MPDHDQQLLLRATGGDREAILELLEALGPGIRRAIAGKIPPRHRSVLDDEDVMQVTYLEAVLRIGQFSTGDIPGFRAWLHTVAENNLRDAIRLLEAAKRPDARRRVVGTREESGVAFIEAMAAGSMTPSRVVAREEAVGWLERTLSAMPPDYERVIRLYDLQGLPIEEVSRELGRRQGAVYMLRARAHEHLAGQMGHASKFFSTGP